MTSIRLLHCWIVYLSLVNYVKNAEECGKNPSFMYQIRRFYENNTKGIEHYQGIVFSNSDPSGNIIEPKENIKYFCKGTFNITVTTYHFWAIQKGLEFIEPGAFDNQKLVGQLLLALNNLQIIKKGTFVNMDIDLLDLHRNRISVIEVGAIENLTQLHNLYLGENQILEFQPNTITNTPKLFSCGLGQNKLRKLEENSMSFMGRDYNIHLDLSINELEEIHPKAFGNASEFVTISYANNKLKTIPKELFINKTYHHTLDLANNSLTTLPQGIFALKDVRELILEGNDFDCATIRRLKLFKELTPLTYVKFDDKSSEC